MARKSSKITAPVSRFSAAREEQENRGAQGGVKLLEIVMGVLPSVNTRACAEFRESERL